MDNPERWNITNSAQNIVSALVDPSKQFDNVFRREWANTFSGFSRIKPSMRAKQDAELRAKLSDYVNKLESRKQIKKLETKREAGRTKEENEVEERRLIKIHVPEVFLLEDFDLSNLETFSKVISSVDRKHSDGYNQHHNHLTTHSFTKSQLKELQQHLTDYLDTVEEKLASQISNRSGDFFQVMSSVDSVMVELTLAIKSVTSLRRKCSKLNNALILPNMKSIHLSKTRNNAQIVFDKMKEMSKLCKVQSMIQLLLSTSDFGGALELVEKSRLMLHRELKGVVCLKHIESQIVEIQTQAENFVNKFHEERKKRIESSLDIEQWKTVDDVPRDFQKLITMLVDENLSIGEIFSMDINQESSNPSSKHHSRASSDAATAAMTTENGLSASHQQQQVNGSRQTSAGISTKLQQQQLLSKFNPNRVNYVRAGGSTYVTVNSVINMIRIVMEYCKCALDIRSLSDEVLERLFTILQLYNSKTYHLVYSAGAIQVAGLKTITTRSLVVCQRSLNLIILLLPAIYKHFSQLLPDYNRLRRFDEIKLYYQDHAAKIPERVNLIIKDVIDLQLQEWKAQPPVPSAQFRVIAEHLMRLHDNIQDALPPNELALLFLKIDETFKDVLRKHLRRLNITDDASPQYWRVKQELTFYKISSASLSMFKGWGEYDDLWSKLNSVESDSNNSKHQ